ncbi:hypothetical protein C9I57_30300 [Trinickia symbiotica]|uniref:HTH luxR-type domain-containing protein n=2 Tax=Trinickia symbiotica TaxID=863227 RepID=A0A2T3XKH6_9BURK|nr:hypothetical protein C9I57_30300 [Trinickia symbiotica]
MTIASRILTQLGGRCYTYRWLHVDQRAGAITGQRCLVGCQPGWVHAYIRHQWYRNDPFVDYARRNGGPALASEIDAVGDHQWANELADRYGFRSMLVCPAHPPSGALIGLLQVGNELQQSTGEPTLWQHRVLLRALADEILDWGIATQREEEASLLDLDQRELTVLRLLRAGRTACNVAENLGISERTAYVIFRKINQKLGVSHIARAVDAATARGLIQ